MVKYKSTVKTVVRGFKVFYVVNQHTFTHGNYPYRNKKVSINGTVYRVKAVESHPKGIIHKGEIIGLMVFDQEEKV